MSGGINMYKPFHILSGAGRHGTLAVWLFAFGVGGAFLASQLSEPSPLIAECRVREAGRRYAAIHQDSLPMTPTGIYRGFASFAAANGLVIDHISPRGNGGPDSTMAYFRSSSSGMLLKDARAADLLEQYIKMHVQEHSSR
jgi:hypothetical protein